MKRFDAFQLLCDCIASWNTSRDTIHRLRQRLLSGRIEWESLAELANRHLLCPTLYAALDHSDLLGCIPAEFRRYLGLLYEGNAERNRKLMALTHETVLHLNEVGVEPILLKGTANLYSGLYPDPNMRFLSDIDLLVPADKTVDCVNRLRNAGYDFLFDPTIWFSQNHIHYPPLLKKNEYLHVEIHEALACEEYEELLDVKNIIRDSELFLIGEACARMPSANHRLIHNVIHAQLSDQNFSWGDIQLRQLYDFILLDGALGSQADWPHIAQLFMRIDSHALSGYVLAGRRFFGHPLPRGIRHTITSWAYLVWLCTQINHSWLMRAGNLTRIALLYRQRLRNCIAKRRIPKLWVRDFRWRHYREMASMLHKNW